MTTDSDEIWRHPDHFVTDDLSWRTDQPVDISASFASNIADSWLTAGPGPFDIDHDETARLIETSWSVSACTFDDFTYVDLTEAVPMGYSYLTVLEKRAVIADGRVQRIWPKMTNAEERLSYGANDKSEELWALITTPSWGSTHLRVGVGPRLWIAVGKVITLSERMNGEAILLTRMLHSEYWH